MSEISSLDYTYRHSKIRRELLVKEEIPIAKKYYSNLDHNHFKTRYPMKNKFLILNIRCTPNL